MLNLLVCPIFIRTFFLRFRPPCVRFSFSALTSFAPLSSLSFFPLCLLYLFSPLSLFSLTYVFVPGGKSTLVHLLMRLFVLFSLYVCFEILQKV